MSNVWHNADKKPMLHRDIILCGDGWSMGMDIIPETVNNICWKNVEKWCYVDDLIKENERTRKQLELAIDALKSAQRYICSDKKSYQIIQTAIEQITAGQKESAFVHNKIEFPEYNDNLLEEFDKQFFENGQDDI